MVYDNKKGMPAVLVSIILMTIVFLILLSLAGEIMTLVVSGTDDLRCTWSAVLHSHTSTFFMGDGFELDCKIDTIFISLQRDNDENPTDITFRQDGNDQSIGVPQRYLNAVESWNQNSYGEGFSFNNPSHRIRYFYDTKISREMIDCKQKLGDGNIELFGNDPSGNTCVICTRFVIPNENDLNYLKHITQGELVGEFLRSNPYSFTDIDHQKSLWEKIRFEGQSDLFDTIGYDMDENLLIVYSVSSGGPLESIPVIGHLFSEDDNVGHNIFLTTPDDLSNYCDTVAN